MKVIEAIGLGILQGVTEFLPISSSGHLIVARTLLGISEPPLLFDVILHVATLLVVCFYFRRRLVVLIRAASRAVTGSGLETDIHDLRLLATIGIATAATAVVGLVVNRLMIGVPRTPEVVSIAFIATAVLLAATRLKPDRASIVRNPGLWLGLAIGIAQGIAVLPGISRAGATIAVCLFASLDRQRTGELAFLVSVPAVLGALALTLSNTELLLLETSASALATGFAAAAISGALCLRALLTILHHNRLAWFAIYLLPLGIVGLVLS